MGRPWAMKPQPHPHPHLVLHGPFWHELLCLSMISGYNKAPKVGLSIMAYGDWT